MIVNATTFKEVQDIFENTNEKEITVIFNSNRFSVKKEKGKLTDLAGCCTGMFDDSVPVKDILKQQITSDVYQES